MYILSLFSTYCRRNLRFLILITFLFSNILLLPEIHPPSSPDPLLVVKPWKHWEITSFYLTSLVPAQLHHSFLFQTRQSISNIWHGFSLQPSAQAGQRISKTILRQKWPRLPPPSAPDKQTVCLERLRNLRTGAWGIVGTTTVRPVVVSAVLSSALREEAAPLGNRVKWPFIESISTPWGNRNQLQG